MPRYVKQRDEYSCAPVALLNLCKWAGVSCAYDSERYRWIKTRCNCKPFHGSPDPFIYATLLALAREYNWAVRFRKDVTVAQIKVELEKGNAVLCCFEYDDGDDHIALITSYGTRGFLAVNWWIRKRTVKLVPWDVVKKTRRRKPFTCWFVRMKGN